jgi:hypothetical protein
MLYQSFESDACAICALANLLSLYGIACSRRQAADLLGASADSYAVVVTHSRLIKVIDSQLSQKSSLGWKFLRRFSFEKLLHTLRVPFEHGAPAVLTFHIRHPRKRWFGLHCAIAIQADDDGIHLVDSLGRRDGQRPNATITPQECAHGWVVAGAPVIVTEQPARILRGLPRLPQKGLIAR